MFYHVPFPWKGSGQHAAIKLYVQDLAMPKNLSCDWLTRFMKNYLAWAVICHWLEQVYSTGVQILDYSFIVQQYILLSIHYPGLWFL